MIGKFLASKWSTVILLAVVAGGLWYIYDQGKSLGGAEELVTKHKERIESQADTIQSLREEARKRDLVLQSQASTIQNARKYASTVEQRTREAEAKANRAVKECLAMHLADGMQFGPSRDSSDKGKARSKLDADGAGSDS